MGWPFGDEARSHKLKEAHQPAAPTHARRHEHAPVRARYATRVYPCCQEARELPRPLPDTATPEERRTFQLHLKVTFDRPETTRRLAFVYEPRNRLRQCRTLEELSPFVIIRMHPNIRRDQPLIRQPDHVHRRRITRRPARPAFERGFQLPDRRIAGTADRIKRQAGSGLAALAHHLQPAVATIETLPDRWRGLRRSAKPFHLFGP
jgi:hypothetical protein